MTCLGDDDSFNKVSDNFLSISYASYVRMGFSTGNQKYTNDQSKLIVVGEYSQHVGGYDFSPVLYYYSNRQGWMLTRVDWNMDKIEALGKKGASLLVIGPRYTAPSNSANYQVEQSPDLIIIEVKSIIQFYMKTRINLFLI